MSETKCCSIIPIVQALETDSGEEAGNSAAPTFRDKPTALLADSRDRWAWLGTDEGRLVRVVPGTSSGWSVRTMKIGAVNCLAVDSAEKQLAVGGENKTIRFVNPKSATRDEKVIFEGHPGEVTALAFAGKGKQLYAGCSDGSLHEWNVKKGEREAFETGHEIRVVAIAVSAKGKRIATADRKGRVKLWDAETRTELASFELDVVTPPTLAFLPDGRLVTPHGKAAALWDLSGL